jgi:peptidoglycan/xylan/chitin deacetylase (PgdA/CDA1 family)
MTLKPVRTIATVHKSIFLTFDDGPEPGMTEKVLDLLDDFEIKATFFVIAEKARKYPTLLKEIQARAHSIGNHSLDHRFSRYFNGYASTLKWIGDSEKIISDLIGAQTIGFRPPWGVRTPALTRVLEQLQMPLILWNTRFYDAVVPWTPEKALRSIQNAQSGAIVLLHDRQPEDRMPLFLNALRVYIDAAKKDGFEMRNLSRSEVI